MILGFMILVMSLILLFPQFVIIQIIIANNNNTWKESIISLLTSFPPFSTNMYVSFCIICLYAYKLEKKN